MRQGISPRALAEALEDLDEFYLRMDACDLGEFMEHPDGTLEALPAGHTLPNVVVFADRRPGKRDHLPMPLRRVGSPYAVTGLTAPQPAPRYTVLRWGRQIRTGAPE